MRKARRILVVLLAFLICLTAQKGLNILNGMALIIDASLSACIFSMINQREMKCWQTKREKFLRRSSICQ